MRVASWGLSWLLGCYKVIRYGEGLGRCSFPTVKFPSGSTLRKVKIHKLKFLGSFVLPE